MASYTYNHSQANVSNLIAEVKKHGIEYSEDIAVRDSKSNTPHSPAQPHETPLAVFFPTSTEDTSRILRACNERRIAVTSFSGGTSFGGALTALRGGVCVSLERMDRLVRLDEEDMDVVVQPGLGWVELNEQLKDKGLFFPVDPAPGARVGGMIAMSCSGTNAYHYGTMKENVISLTCVLASGRIFKTHNRPRKSSAGYDLTHLVIGSEGTLALVTEAVLRLSPVPKNLHVGLATFRTFQDGVGVVVALQKLGHKLEALELVDGEQMHCVNHSRLSTQTFSEKPTLFFKIASPSLQLVQDQIGIMRELCKQQVALSTEISDEKERVELLWGARKCMGRALLSMKRETSDLFMHSDCAVPISNLSKLVDGSHDLVQAAGREWFVSNTAHIGDGNVHTAIVCPASDYAAASAVLHEIAMLALRLEGTVTGEHGVGVKLREALEEEVGVEGIAMMRSMKKALDPNGILNPEKVFRLDGDEVEKAKL